MKKFIFLPALLLPSFLIFLLVGCSKDKSALSPSNNDAISAENTSTRFGNWGFVTGMILPLRAEVSIATFNDKITIKEFYYTKDGQFRVDRIPPGIYTIVITYLRPGDNPETGITPNEIAEYTVTDIKVTAGRVTDIGIIKLR